MSLSRVIIWGASGHALVVADILRLSGQYEVVGMLDDVNISRHGTKMGDTTILGGSEQFDNLKRNGTTHLIVAIGDCSVRKRLATTAVSNGFHLATAIHLRATVARDALIGAGTVIAAGAVVNPGVQIGTSCIINTNASVDHECVVGDAVHIGPGATLGGRVTVGTGAWVAIGATVLDRIHIGEESTIGAGAVVTKDIPDRVVAYGVPCKVIRTIAST